MGFNSGFKGLSNPVPVTECHSIALLTCCR